MGHDVGGYNDVADWPKTGRSCSSPHAVISEVPESHHLLTVTEKLTRGTAECTSTR